MKQWSRLILLGMILFMAAEAHAGCTISATGIIFGAYDPVSPTPLDTSGTITVACNNPPGPPTDVTISVSPSTHSGTFNPRQMKHSTLSYFLDYNLYTKQNRTTVWGDGAAGTATVMIQGTKSRKVTIYGSISTGQNVPAGSYSDSLTITVTP